MYAKVFSGEAEVNTPGTVFIDVGTFHVPYQPERIIPRRHAQQTRLKNPQIITKKYSGEAENLRARKYAARK